MARAKSQLVFSDLTGGINNVDTKETLNASTRRTETPDMLNVEYFGLGGIKSMEGNTQIGDTQDSAIVGGHEYTKGNKRYMMIATQDGDVKEYDAVENKYNDVYKFNSKSDKVSFCNMNNGVVVTNGKDDLLFYEKGRNTQLTGVINLNKDNKDKLYGKDTLFKSELRVGDYINIENCIGSYKVIDVESNTVATVDKNIEQASGVKYYGWEGEKYTANIVVGFWDGNVTEITKDNPLYNEHLSLDETNNFIRVGNNYNSRQTDALPISNGKSIKGTLSNYKNTIASSLYQDGKGYTYCVSIVKDYSQKQKEYTSIINIDLYFGSQLAKTTTLEGDSNVTDVTSLDDCFLFLNGTDSAYYINYTDLKTDFFNTTLTKLTGRDNMLKEFLYYPYSVYNGHYLMSHNPTVYPIIKTYSVGVEYIARPVITKSTNSISVTPIMIYNKNIKVSGAEIYPLGTTSNTIYYIYLLDEKKLKVYYNNSTSVIAGEWQDIGGQCVYYPTTDIYDEALGIKDNKLYFLKGASIEEKTLSASGIEYMPIKLYDDVVLAESPSGNMAVFYKSFNSSSVKKIYDIPDYIFNIKNIRYEDSGLTVGNLYVWTETNSYKISISKNNIITERKPFGYWQNADDKNNIPYQKNLENYNLSYNEDIYIPDNAVVDYYFNKEANTIYSKTLDSTRAIDIYSNAVNTSKLNINNAIINVHNEIEYYTDEYVCRDYRNESLDKINPNEELPSDNLNINLTEISECNAYLVNTDPDLASSENIHTPIRGTAIQYYNGRLWVGTDNGLFYSAVGLPNNWDIYSDAGVLYSIYNDSSKIGALGLFSEYLMVHKEFSTYILTCSGESSTIEVKPFSNITCESQQGWIVSNTKYFVFSKDFLDIYPLIQHTVFNDKFLGEPVTQKVRNLFKNIRLEDTDKVFCVGRPRERQMIFYLPMSYANGSAIALIFDFQTKSWLLRQVPQDVTTAFQYNNRIYIGTKDGKVLEEFKGDTFDGEAINAYYKSPWFDWTGDYTQSFSEFIIEIDNSVNNTFKLDTYKDGGERTETRIINTDRLLKKSLIWGNDDDITLDEENWDDNNWAGGTFETIRMVLPNNVFTNFQLEFSTDKDNPSFRIYKYGFRRIETEEVPW